MKKGKFIVFEGIDGSGKSTISKLVFRKLNDDYGNTHLTFEPTDGPIGSLIRNILNKRIIADEKTLGTLFLADRLDHIGNPVSGILTYLEKGIHVISDRFYYSSYAYHVPPLSLDWLINAHTVCTEMLRPDIVFYIDLPVEESLKRLKKSRQFRDIFETREKLEQVTLNYKEALKREGKKDNVVIIDGLATVEEIFKKVTEKLSTIIE
ncbi:MAG: dTMP kinase [Chlorobi bacterium]|nr:dTMP kinase [Chlorobiota bacterium]